MKKIHAYIGIALMALLAATSCSDDDIFGRHDLQAKFTLTLPGEDVLTRADDTDPGKDAFNENTVSTVDLYFYHTGAADQNAVLHKRILASEITRNTTATDEEAGTYVYDLTSSIGITELRTIFPNYDTEGATYSCVVYAIVNLPEDAEITDTDIESLKQVELTCSTFSELTEATNASFKKGVIPENFVMSGQSTTITLDANNKRNLVGNIDVYRSASKVTLELTEVSDEFEDANHQIWQSQTNNITVGLKHGQTVGYVDAPELHNVTGDFTTKNIIMNAGTWGLIEGSSTGHYITDVPLYTYPNDWSNDLSHRTSLLVCVWWKNTSVANSSFQPTYYEIPISDEDEKLIRNYHYHIQLKIGIIGSLVEEEPVKLDHCSYVILPWGTNNTIFADMNQVRYLVVDQTEIHMDNVIAQSINYSSSHRLDIINKHLYVRDLESTNATWKELPANAFRIVIKDPTDGSGSSYLTVEHDLVNNMDEYSDYTQFKMEFDVYHYDEDPTNTKYIEHIVAYQTPMIYTEIDPNSDFADATLENVWVDGHWEWQGWSPVWVDGHYELQFSDPDNNQGYAYVNGTQNADNNYGGIHGLTGMNKNPNRYIIKATALTSDQFIIGDPRTIYVHNLNNNAPMTSANTAEASWSTRSRALYRNGQNNRLLYYHPTDENNARTENMISPEFMIASSYGVCSTGINKADARRRCASYQEDGYPAGRWRLPTSAEIKYIVQLSAWGKIPILFGILPDDDHYGDDSDYWSANGVMRVNTEDGTSGLIPENQASDLSVRCVYDTWYWTDTCTKNQFTWGDKTPF